MSRIQQRISRALRLVTEVRENELQGLCRFFILGFTLLVSYYIIRALREGLILVDFGAGARSMAVGVAAVTLMFVVPLYSRLRRRYGSQKLVIGIFAFFTSNILLFWLGWEAGWKIGFVFFVWVGLFGLMVVAQFWAMANGCWNEDAGKRLFPVIMIGANLGALAGTEVAAWASHHHGMYALMLVGMGLLALATLMVPWAWRSVPDSSRPQMEPTTNLTRHPSVMGGFSVVLRDHYLLLIAAMVVLLNLVNSTGEYLFAQFVELHTASELPPDASHDQQAEYVTAVYANYMLWYTSLGLLIQTFLVSRLFRWIGVGGSALLLPVVMVFSYLLLAFIPIFSIIRWVKISENALDYSLLGTVRHALFLPTSDEAKFDGKTAIDTFFWRLGDLIQAGVVWAGLHWLDWDIRAFALFTAVASLAFVAVTWALAREYRRRVPDDGKVLPNRYIITPGEAVDVRLPGTLLGEGTESFSHIAAHVDEGAPLPSWLSFDGGGWRLHGLAPADLNQVIGIEVVGEDASGAEKKAPVSLVPVRKFD